MDGNVGIYGHTRSHDTGTFYRHAESERQSGVTDPHAGVNESLDDFEALNEPSKAQTWWF